MRLFLYKIKLGVLYLRNLIYLNKGFKSLASPELIFLRQFQDSELRRYDVIIRYLFIDYLMNNNTYGKDLYRKMQIHRAGSDLKTQKNYLKKETNLQKIVDGIKKNGKNAFKQKPCIRLNREYKLCDGSHRLAAALYFNIPKICYTRSQTRSINYGLDELQFLKKNEISVLSQIVEDIINKIDITKVLNEILSSQSQQFGRGMFYQSFEEIGIQGQRPTEKRFKIYQLEKILSKEMTVLDIGSNCGFFSLLISKYVKSIEGIEYNKSLFEISNITKNLLKIDNANFINSNFKDVKSEKRYDLILSFAVHYWIGLEIGKYAKLLHEMLNENGYVLLESQNVLKEDKDWDQKIKKFISAGFNEINSGELCDDGIINRKFSLLQKIEHHNK